MVFEHNVGENPAHFSAKWGDDYNRNNISAMRSMVFSNSRYDDTVSHLDPELLGFCPLPSTLFEQQGKTTALFNRPGTIAENSPAKELLMKIDSEVVVTVRPGLL